MAKPFPGAPSQKRKAEWMKEEEVRLGVPEKEKKEKKKKGQGTVSEKNRYQVDSYYVENVIEKRPIPDAEEKKYIEDIKTIERLFKSRERSLLIPHQTSKLNATFKLYLKLANDIIHVDNKDGEMKDVPQRPVQKVGSQALLRYKKGSGMINHIARTQPKTIKPVSSVEWLDDMEFRTWNNVKYMTPLQKITQKEIDGMDEWDKQWVKEGDYKKRHEIFPLYIAELDYLFAHRCGVTKEPLLVYRGISLSSPFGGKHEAEAEAEIPHDMVTDRDEIKMTKENKAIHQWYNHDFFKWLDLIAPTQIGPGCGKFFNKMWLESVPGARSRIEGKIFQENSFCSTTLAWSYVQSFAMGDSSRDFVMAILVPAGTHYLMPKYVPSELDEPDAEYELLFPRGLLLEALFNGIVCLDIADDSTKVMKVLFCRIKS
jgi:hypothetical protein